MAERARKRVRRRGHVQRSSRWPYLAATAVAVAAMIGVAALLQSRGGDGDTAGEVIVPSPRSPELLGNGRIVGQPDAPVSVIEYADFQ